MENSIVPSRWTLCPIVKVILRPDLKAPRDLAVGDRWYQTIPIWKDFVRNSPRTFENLALDRRCWSHKSMPNPKPNTKCPLWLTFASKNQRDVRNSWKGHLLMKVPHGDKAGSCPGQVRSLALPRLCRKAKIIWGPGPLKAMTWKLELTQMMPILAWQRAGTREGVFPICGPGLVRKTAS